MGNTHVKPHPRTRNKKQVHWKAADRPSPPGKPDLVPETESTPDVVTIRWTKPIRDGGSPITGYLVEHKRTGSPHWVRATPLLVPFTELTLSGLEPGWRYQFRVSAENAVGMSDPGELSEPLTVTLQRSAITAPRFTEELQDKVALENDKVEFETHFLGQPAPKICWFKDGFEIFSSRRTRIITENDRSILTIHQSALTDEGEIKCTATNRAGHTSTKAQLTLEAPPNIRLPRQYEDGLLFELGEVMRLKISIAGRPTPLIFWSHNDESLQNDERYEIENTDKSSVLKIGEATRIDRGEYQIKAVNKLGSDVTSFLVTVTDKPSPPGRARVLMTLGRSVTLSWSTPQDDGGCKIGNYIIEYYRLGWNMWLKAATSRQLTTILGDLIEGSEYRFRVKAESPYGISDPSEESETIFIPDPKRGLLLPPTRSKSQPRDILDEVVPVAVKRRHKPRSQSSSRAETESIMKVPQRPERTKIKSPPKTPDLSPRSSRRESNSDKINTAIFDRSSMARELSYGSPEIKVRKTESSLFPKDDRSSSSSPVTNLERRNESNLLEKEKRSVSPRPNVVDLQKEVREKPEDKNRNTMLAESKLLNVTLEEKRKSPSPKNERKTSLPVNKLSLKEKSPSPNTIKKEKSPSPIVIKKEKSPSPIVIKKEKSPSPVFIKREKSPNSGFTKRENSPSPEIIKKEKSPSPFEPRYKLSRENRENFTGSSEFMLVLYPDEENRGRRSTSEIRFDYETSLPPPMSLSAPELGGEIPQFFDLRSSASSTELLHERAMMRFYQEALAEEAELEKKRNKTVDERRLSGIEIPKIQINSKDEQDLIGLERKHSLRRRLSAGGSVPQHILWAQRRHSLRNSNDLSEIIEGKLKSTPSPESRRKMTMHRQRSESEEREEQEFEKVRARMALQKQLSAEKRSIEVVDEEKWDPAEEPEYEESISEEETESSEDERLKYTPSKSIYADYEEEEETYHPGMMMLPKPSKPISDEPFEILTKPNPLPDPNFVPKPILKKKEYSDEFKVPEVKQPKHREDVWPSPPQDTSRQRSFSLITPAQDQNTARQRSYSLEEHNVPLTSTKLDFPSDKGGMSSIAGGIKSIAAVAQISAITAASIVIPERLLNKRKDEEEAKVVIDHYGDIVKSYGNKKSYKPQAYLDHDELKRAAEQQEIKEPLFEHPQMRQSISKTYETVVTEKPFLRPDTPRHEISQFSQVSQENTKRRSPSPSPGRISRKTPPRSPTRHENWSNLRSGPSKPVRKTSPSPMRRNRSPAPMLQNRSPSPTSFRRKDSSTSKQSQVIKRKTSPSPMRREITSRSAAVTTISPRPKMREIMTQTSVGLESFSSDSLSRTSTPSGITSKQEELIAKAEVKVRNAFDYIADLAMFVVACWLYLFENELLAIPVLLVMAYRQIRNEIRKRIPQWILKRLRKNKDK